MSLSIVRLYRRICFGEPIIVVSGLPRSGTSMLMKMLEAGGLQVVTDGQRAADEDNPKGYYEVERVKALAQEKDKTYLADARGKVVKVISFLLKSLPANLNYRVIFVKRNLDEVLASQRKMLVRRGEADDTPEERMRELLETDVWRAGYMLRHARQFESIEVQYAELVARPEEHARRIAAFLGGGLDVQAMVSVVDPALYRNRAPTPGAPASV
jgi:hypothetical protein